MKSKNLFNRGISLAVASSMLLSFCSFDFMNNVAYGEIVEQQETALLDEQTQETQTLVDPNVANKDAVPKQVNVHMGADASKSVNITYTTIVQVPSKIVVNKVGDSEKLTYEGTSSLDNSGVKYIHAIIADNLEANTVYEYTVGDGVNVFNGKFKTAPETGSKESFKFAYLSDTQVANADDAKALGATLEDISNNEELSFVYLSGDVTDTSTSELQWELLFNNGGAFPDGGKNMFGNKTIAVIQGNHDNNTMNRHINAPAEEGNIVYSFDYGPATFIMLNLETARYDATARDKQKEFLTNAVQDAKARGQWVMTGFHKSLITGASHITDGDIIEARQYWLPVFAELDVDFVLQGHDHVYSRGFVNGDGTRAYEEKAEGTIADPFNAPLYMVGGHAGGLKWYSKKNYTVADGDPLLPGYAFLDVNSTDDGSDIKKEQVEVELEVSSDSVSINTYMFKYDTTTDTITTEKYLYDSLTVTREDVSVLLSSDNKTLLSYEPNSSIKLNTAAKDKLGTDIDLTSGAAITYRTDKEDLLNISEDGTVTIKNVPAQNETAKVYADVKVGEKTYISNALSVTILTATVFSSVDLTIDENKILADSNKILNLGVAAKDQNDDAMNMDNFTVSYKTSSEGVLAVTTEGAITLQNRTAHNSTVKVWAEVSNGTETIKSNEVSVEIVLPELQIADGYVESGIKTGMDDVEEFVLTGELYSDSSDLELVLESPDEELDKEEQLVGLRFTELSIPKGAKILDAYIQFTVDEADKNADPFNVNIKAEASANSQVFANESKNISNRTLTEKTVEWKDLPQWTVENAAGPDQQTPNISSLVQEIVDMSEWNEGNAMTFVLGGTGTRTAEAFESGANIAPKLMVTFIKDPSNIEISLPIQNSTDDTEERADGTLDYDSSDLEIVDEDSSQVIGLRFDGLNVPKGAKIVDAYVQFTVDEPDKSKDPFNVKIQAEDVANSDVIENNNFEISSRTKTSNSVEWKDIPLWTEKQVAKEAQRTSNISSLVQEIVDKEEWNVGNAITLILSGTGTRVAEAFEGAGNNINERPTLKLVYSLEDETTLPGDDDDDDDDDDDVNDDDNNDDQEPGNTADKFEDIKDHWANNIVRQAILKNIIKGVDENHFEPNRDIKRSEVSAMIVRALGLTTSNNNNKFSDVNTSEWFYEEVSAAYENGILKGYEDGKINPNKPLTRQEAMAIIERALILKGAKINLSDSEVSNYLSKFNDADEISQWAKKSAAICVKNNIFEGNNGSLKPNDNITRAETAKIVLLLNEIQ